uniref:Gustatory receptor n=1 Tax=Anopheles christyi TaxID=43041 RepID=A0A182JRX5_9DIPT
MQVLNIFHGLLICNVRTVRRKGHPGLIGYKISRARVQLILPLVAISTLAFLNPWTARIKLHTNNLNSFTIYARLLATLIIVLLLIFDNFRQRYQLLGLLQIIPNTVATRKRIQLSVKQLQLSILLLCNVLSLAEMTHNIYKSRMYFYIWGVFSGILIEHYILLNSLLCQLLAETLANAYNTLKHNLSRQPFTSIINELESLEECKNHLSKMVGFKLMLVLLHLMLNVSFCSYDILQKVVSQEHLSDITRLAIIATQETVMLFGLCFHFTTVDKRSALSHPAMCADNVIDHCRDAPLVAIEFMEELKILNLFNHFLVSPVQLHNDAESNRHIFRNRNLLWNTAVLSFFTVFCAAVAFVLVLEAFAQLLSNVMGVITLILYSIRLVVIVPIIFWTLLNGRALADISNCALDIDRQFGTDRTVDINVRLLTQCQIYIALLMLLFNIAVQCYYIYTYEFFRNFIQIAVVIGFFFLETFIFIHRAYVQFWPTFLSHRYAKLIRHANYKERNSLHTVIALGSVLESFKRKFNSTFGLMQLLHLLNIFVTCSVEAYIVFHVVDVGREMYGVTVNLVSALTYGASFLIYTYAHNLVNVKRNRYTFRYKNVVWNVALLSVLVAINCFGATVMLVEFMQDKLDSVMGACNIILYIMRLSVVISLILWILLYRRKLLEDVAVALHLIQDKYNSLYQTPSNRNTCILCWIQIGSIVILLIAAVVGDVCIWWKIIARKRIYYILNLGAFIILDFVSLMHLMYTQCLTLVIAYHLNQLVRLVQNNPDAPNLLQKVTASWDDLKHYKQRIESTLGVMNVLHVLDALVKCAVETYVTFCTYEMGLGLVGAFLDIVTFLLYTASLFFFTYAHDLVEMKMHELSFLNVFNYCVVSPIYLHFDIQSNCYAFRYKNVFWNVMLLVVLDISSFTCATFLMFEVMREQLGGVMTTTTILLYMMRFVIMLPLSLWIWLYKERLRKDCTFALSIFQEKEKQLLYMPKNKGPRQMRQTLELFWIQIGIIVLLLLAGAGVHLYSLWKVAILHKGYYIFNLCALVVMVFITLMHLMYAQCWTMVISLHLEELVWLIQHKDLVPDLLQTVITCWDDLNSFKQRITSTFGFMTILHMLDVLVTCAIESYAIIYFYEKGINMGGALLSIVILVLYTASCFLFAYAHDLIEVKQSLPFPAHKCLLERSATNRALNVQCRLFHCSTTRIYASLYFQCNRPENNTVPPTSQAKDIANILDSSWQHCLPSTAVVGNCAIWWEVIATQKEYYLLNICALAALEIITLMHLLNVFNHFFISLVFVEQTAKGSTARRKNALRNILMLLAPVSIVTFIGLTRTLNNFNQMVSTVTEIVHLLKYSINGQIIYVMLSGMYNHSLKVIAICNEAIAIDHTIQHLPSVENLFAVRHTLFKMLIVVIILFRASFFAMHMYVQIRYNLSYDVYTVLHGNLLIELSMDLQKLFLLYFALYMAQRYHVLVHLLSRRDLATMVAVYKVFDDLTTLKKHLSKTFGLYLLALILQTFVACSIHAFLILVEHRHIFQVIANVAQLVINLALFFILTYYYDNVEFKVGLNGWLHEEHKL